MQDRESLLKELERIQSFKGKCMQLKVCQECNAEYIAGTSSKHCHDCWLIRFRAKPRRIRQAKTREKDHCLFCKTSEKLQVHHIDRNPKNNDPKNLALLCSRCHINLHKRMYNPLLKRFYSILVKERFSYDQIGELFGTTKQNVYNVLNR